MYTNNNTVENIDSIHSRVNFADNIFKGKLNNLIDMQNEIYDLGDLNNRMKFSINRKSYNLNKIFNKIDCKLTNTNITKKNIYFKGTINKKAIVNVKISLCEKSYDCDIKRSNNNEIMMSILLSKFVINGNTPHIVLPIATFYANINELLCLQSDIVQDEKKYAEFLNEYRTNNYSNMCSIIINEYSNSDTLMNFIKRKLANLTLYDWKIIFFQIISVLAVIQSKYPTFRHNEFTPKILMVNKLQKNRGNFLYTVCHDCYIVGNIGYIIKLCDFDNAYIPNIIGNDKMHNTVNNRYYDLQYFFCSLIAQDCCPEILTSPHVPMQIKDFIKRIIPDKYRELSTNNEYLIPNDILTSDPLFKDLRDSYLKIMYKKIDELINKTKNNYSIYHNIGSDIYRVLYKQQPKIKQICCIYWCMKNINDNDLWLPRDMLMEILQFVFIKIIVK